MFTKLKIGHSFRRASLKKVKIVETARSKKLLANKLKIVVFY